MFRWFPAPIWILAVIAAAPACCCAGSDRPAAVVQAADPPGPPTRDAAEVIKRFDFDERPLGNYEETPLHWVHVTGPGLPRYSAGRLDERIGHEAPPSFRLDVQGGHVCYEYRGNDLAIVPDTDYVVVAHVRAEGLQHARALLHAYLIDRTGERISGSDSLSPQVGSQAASGGEEPWQRVEAAIAGDFPDAHALRLELWVVQPDAWRPPDPSEPDPVIRQDVRATVWFDDILICRLPRVRLGLSSAGGIVAPGETAALVLDVHNVSPDALVTELTVRDSAGRTRLSDHHPTPGMADAPVELPLPALEPGLYVAQLDLAGRGQTLISRTVQFAILPALPAVGASRFGFGADLGGWPGGDVAAVSRLLRELGCGTARIGMPMTTTLDGESQQAYVDGLRELARKLLGDRIAVVGVILSPSAAARRSLAQSTRDMLAGEPRCELWLGPVLAHLGGLVSSWQLGSEPVELAAASRWDAAAIAALRSRLERFMAAPELVVPSSAFDDQPSESKGDPMPPEADTVWVPADVPARRLPQQLALLMQRSGNDGDQGRAGLPGRNQHWIALSSPPAGLSREQRLAETIRRVTLAKAMGAERAFVPAPFELSSLGGSPAWQPTDDYMVLRTLFHYLVGKQALGALPLPDQDGLVVVFGDGERACAVAWTWREAGCDAPTELYLGPTPVAVDLFGRQAPLPVQDGRAHVRLGTMPVILDEIDAPLVLLQASFRVEPTCVQLHDPEPRPVVRFKNYYDQDLIGTLHLTLPPDWNLAAAPGPFALRPGQTLSETLVLELPPRELAMERSVQVRLELSDPASAVLEFAIPMTVGLRDVNMEVEMHWSDGDLVLEQSLSNLSARPLSFSAFCQPPGRAEMERAFLNVGPGETRVQAYHLPQARDLVGSALRMGVREIQGQRTLDHLVEIHD